MSDSRSLAMMAVAAVALMYAVPSVLAGCPFSHRAQSHPGSATHHTHAPNSKNPHGPTERAFLRSFRARDPPTETIGDDNSPLGPWQGQIPMAGNTSDPLVVFNNAFHKVYSEVGVQVRPDPVVMVEVDYLVLRRNHTRVLVLPFTPPIYHDLKMVCHMPLAVFITLEPLVLATNATVSLDATTLSRLQSFATAMETALSALTLERYPAAGQLSRQRAIANATIKFITSMVDEGSITYAQAAGFTSGLAHLIRQNILEAGTAQVDMLSDAMDRIQALLTPAEWEALRVVVTTSHMARPQNLVSQFFSRLFDVDIFQSQKFVTLEEESSEEAVLKLLDTHVTDYGAGQAFFGDAYRMHEDVLCHAAKTRLDQLFPATANTTLGCFNTDQPIQ